MRARFRNSRRAIPRIPPITSSSRGGARARQLWNGSLRVYSKYSDRNNVEKVEQSLYGILVSLKVEPGRFGIGQRRIIDEGLLFRVRRYVENLSSARISIQSRNRLYRIFRLRIFFSVVKVKLLFHVFHVLSRIIGQVRCVRKLASILCSFALSSRAESSTRRPSCIELVDGKTLPFRSIFRPSIVTFSLDRIWVCRRGKEERPIYASNVGLGYNGYREP